MRTPPPNSSSARLGISAMGLTTLIAVVAVSVVITLSSLRGLAMRENESHAQALLRALGESMSREVQAAPPRDLRELTEADDNLEAELDDMRWSGDYIFRHGYFVELLPSGASDSSAPMLVAWPSQHGRTGTRTFAWRSDKGLVVPATPEQPWSGLERRPTAVSLNATN